MALVTKQNIVRVLLPHGVVQLFVVEKPEDRSKLAFRSQRWDMKRVGYRTVTGIWLIDVRRDKFPRKAENFEVEDILSSPLVRAVS